MRIAHIGRLRSVSSNGVDRTICGLIQAQKSRGHEVEVWEFSPHSKQVSVQMNEMGVQIYSLPTTGTHLLNSSSRTALCERRSVVDIVHAHSVFIPEQIQAVSGFRYVLTPNGGYMPAVLNGRNRFIKYLWLAILERRYLQGAQAIHAVSRNEKDFLDKFLPSNEIVYIPNGVHQSDIPPLPMSHIATTRDFRFLGRLAVKQKGLDLLLKAFALSRLKQVGAKLIIAGPDFRDGLSTLRRLAEDLSVTDSVEFRGELSRSDVRQFLSAPSIFVHPSRWEGMPFSLIEALAHGMPVIVTPGTNLSEEVSNASSGWCCTDDSASLAEVMKTAFSLTPDSLAAMQRNAQSLVRTHFIWESIAKQVDCLYEKALVAS